MIKIGQFNFLQISQKSERGTLLSAGQLGSVFLSKKETPNNCNVGDKLQVFIYQNARDEIVATTRKPKIELGGVACLKVISTSNVGAFMDWGLPKDLFVPFGQQAKPMKSGQSHLVYMYEDNTGRLCASSKLNRMLDEKGKGVKEKDKVNLLVGDKTELGYKVVVNQKFWGLLHHSDVFRELQYGQALSGVVKKIRNDGKVDIALQAGKEDSEDKLATKILKQIASDGGFSPYHDKSPPERIYQVFGVSKKAFKAALGTLYKQKKITIEENGIRLTEDTKS
ncbi:MAG: S1-like domain-containing RNA-binding protein [Gammaproteobacteria bacterium]|nr:S1-like domain-containing RNA-binding protein [Gammaproteobacteria bacterium]MDH5630956.1 S1-like domain-containing RNA-binding protein [Gammaproteobacteria bacterium]